MISTFNLSSIENHYHVLDQNDNKKRIYTIKGKENWFDGESMSVYDIKKTEILTASTNTENMIQVCNLNRNYFIKLRCRTNIQQIFSCISLVSVFPLFFV